MRIKNIHLAPLIIWSLIILLLLSSACTNKVDTTKELERGKRLLKNDSALLSVEIFSDLISINDTCYNCYLDRGIAYKKLGDYNNALKDFTSLTIINKNNFIGFANTAAIYYLKDDCENSLKYFLKAFELDTSRKNFYNPISHMLFFTGKKDEACTYYSMAMAAGYTEFNSEIVDYCKGK